MEMKRKQKMAILALFSALAVGACLWGCSSSNGEVVATETREAEYAFWTDISRDAVDSSVALLNEAAGRTGGKPELIALTNAGFVMIDGRSTEACLDGLREHAEVSEGRRTLLSVHAATDAPLWFFLANKDTGDGVYSEVDPAALHPVDFSVRGELFSTQNLRNVNADQLFSNPSEAHETLFDAKAFNGNEFRIAGIVHALMENAPYDLVRSIQFHDHYCPGVTSGLLLTRFLERHFPRTAQYGNYFVLSMPPWCKDDALMTLLNATPGKKGYGVSYLSAEDSAALREDAKDIAGVFFRWNGNGAEPEGEGMALAFDFDEARAANNWGEDTPWNWWESRLKMNLWFLDHLDTPERFIETIPIHGHSVFHLSDLETIGNPSDLSRPAANPLEILGLNRTGESGEFALWHSVGRRAAEEGLALLKDQGAAPDSGDLIVLTNAGYAEMDGQTTEGVIDGLTETSGVRRGQNRLLEIQSHAAKPLYAAIYDTASGLCAYLQANPAFPEFNVAPTDMAAADLFAIRSVQNIHPDFLYANSAEAAARFDEKIFGGNEFAVVTIANAVAAGAPAYAVRSFEFHDHYCPGVTSGIMMAQFVKENLPPASASGGYFVQGVQPWCKEDALMVMLNATPGKSGYAATFPADADKARWLPEFQNASTIVYRKDGDTGRWDGQVLGFAWGETDCPTTGNSVIDKLCADLWYLERLDVPEDFVTVLHSFELPEGTQPKDYARPGVDPMEMLGLTVSE